jgi:hypothetical protein
VSNEFKRMRKENGTAPDFGVGTEQNHKNSSLRLVGVREGIRNFHRLNASKERYWGTGSFLTLRNAMRTISRLCMEIR